MERYAEYKDSGIECIGEVPAHWQVCPLKRHYSYSTGFTPDSKKTEYYADEGLPWITIADMTERVVSTSATSISQKYLEENECTLVPEGSLLYSFKLSTGKTAFAGRDLYTNEAIASFLPSSHQSLGYLQYASYLIEENANVNIYGAKLLNQETLNSAPLPFPPLKEQESIAHYLDEKTPEIDALIEGTVKSIKLLEEYRKSVFSEAVTKGLNPDVPMKDPGIEWIGEIPEHWEIRKLGSLCSFINGDRGANYPSGADFTDEGVPFVGASALKNDFVDLDLVRWMDLDRYDAMGGLKIKSGDSLYTLRGSTIGKNAVARFNEGTVSSSLMGIRANPQVIDFLYLHYWLNSQQEFFQRDRCINGSTAPNLSAEDVAAFRIALPPLIEQISIGRFLETQAESIQKAIETEDALVERLSEYRKSLISEAVTGKIKVPGVS